MTGRSNSHLLQSLWRYSIIDITVVYDAQYVLGLQSRRILLPIGISPIMQQLQDLEAGHIKVNASRHYQAFDISMTIFVAETPFLRRSIPSWTFSRPPLTIIGSGLACNFPAASAAGMYLRQTASPICRSAKAGAPPLTNLKRISRAYTSRSSTYPEHL